MPVKSSSALSSEGGRLVVPAPSAGQGQCSGAPIALSTIALITQVPLSKTRKARGFDSS